MIGCIFIAFLMIYTGVYYTAYNLNYGYPYFSYTLAGALLVFLIGMPLLTMRSFAEERKNKTDQLLLTSPVSIFRVVMGKYLAMVSILAVPIVIFILYPLIIKMNGTAYLKVDYVSLFMFFLLGCVFIAIGMFMSTLTESQIIAYIVTFGVLLAIYLWEGLLDFLPTAISNSSVGTVLAKFDLAQYMTNIYQNNLLEIDGPILYLSLIVIFVLLTIQSIQKRRWS